MVKLLYSPLSISEAKLLLEDPPKDKLIKAPPCCPKGGEVYIYSFSETIRKGTLVAITKFVIKLA